MKKHELKTICENATQKRFTAWQGATGAGMAELRTDDILALIESHERLLAALIAGVQNEMPNSEWIPIAQAAIDTAG